MKRFFVNGENANWANLNVVALNVKSGIISTETAVPEHLRLQVTIADKFDTNLPNLEEISEGTSEYAMRHGKRRHFLLISGDKVVGWAAFHRKERTYKVSVELRSEDEFEVEAKSYNDAYRKAVAEAEETYGDIFSEILNVELAE